VIQFRVVGARGTAKIRAILSSMHAALLAKQKECKFAMVNRELSRVVAKS
jgi:hypothetical protein